MPHPDHPRSRGVYESRIQSFLLAIGSSPLARGLQQSATLKGHYRGIIPARAGFTSSSIRSCSSPWDHPRSRGVYAGRGWLVSARVGSSPLARGLPVNTTSVTLDLRIIPARAGFTPRPLRTILRAWDHPRSRGVYGFSGSAMRRTTGSSPLARGLLWAAGLLVGAGGIIPARAGFTAWAHVE